LFVVHGKIVDHLKPDGTPDQQERPNTIFTRRLVPDSVFAREIRNVVEHLTYPYGVASLAQTDADFHPYHEYPPMYPKDAAYHNGTVWTWLQGPLISELCRYGCTDLAWELTQNTVHQILDRGTAGTQSELLDAVPRPGESEPRLSGTFSQAWNLAEFVRTFYDDYLGIKVLSGKKELWLNPHLPEILTDVRAPVTLNGSQLMVELHRIGDTTRYVFDARSCSTPLTASLVRHDRVFSLSLQSGATTTCQIVGKAATASTGAGEVRVNTKQITPAPQIEGKLAFATPIVSPGLRAMQGPGYPLISNATIKRTNPTAQLLVDAMDPEGDDTGVDCSSGALLEYTYPLSRHFVAGSFDITRFTARRDSATLYCVLQFKRLSDPGWHPEYGFQLTYCAIAIDNAPGGKRQIGHNAACMVDEGSSFERLITVGGGVQVEDATGKILGAYLPVPADAASPLGDAGSGTITFALPLTLVGPIDSLTRFTILAGAQDDHGGAGIGEFRTVNEKAGEWNGGGRRGSSNVYDRLVAGR
jgi:hypothetical protein